MKKILIIGKGISGTAVGKYLEKQGNSVFFYDDRDQEKTCISYKQACSESFDLFVFSPGISHSHPLYQLAEKMRIPTTSEIALGLKNLRSMKIGVTGSHFKTTAVSFLEQIFQRWGLDARAIGNNGKPVISHVDTPPEIALVELSSFQLLQIHEQTLDYSILLNVHENHIDWHGSFLEYLLAKISIFAKTKNISCCLMAENIRALCQSYHIDLDERIALFPTSIQEGMHPYLQQILPIARFFADRWEYPISEDIFTNLTFLEHRLEKVPESSLLEIYNDSKSTTPTSTLFALDFFPKRLILIAGGRAKNTSFEEWKQRFFEKVKMVIVFGENKNHIAMILHGVCPVVMVDTLREAVKKAFTVAEKNDTILFSPGCTSLDQFDSYSHRGEVFKKEVQHEATRFDHFHRVSEHCSDNITCDISDPNERPY